MKVSVIIPWYRAEQWWSSCEASISSSISRCTSDIEWEMIVVRDDEHKGVGWARNEGLKRAKGDWIVWVDADDEVTNEWAMTIEHGVNTFKEADIIVFDHMADGVLFSWGEREGYISKEKFLRSITADKHLKSYMWDKIFNKEYLLDKGFSETRYFEDYDFWTRNAGKVHKVAYLPVNCYKHIGRKGGLIAQSEAARGWIRIALKRLLVCRYKVSGLIALARAIYYWARTQI